MFDPTDHTVAEVRDYLRTHPEQTAAVVDIERNRPDGEPRSSILALAPESSAEPALPPAATDVPPTAGSEATGSAEVAVAPAGTIAQPAATEGTNDPVQAELDSYADRLGNLSAEQRQRLEASLDDGTDWDRMQTDPVVRARFGAALTNAERPFAAPQDTREGAVPFGSEPSGGQAYDEDGGLVSVDDVRGEPTTSAVAPARGEE